MNKDFVVFLHFFWYVLLYVSFPDRLLFKLMFMQFANNKFFMFLAAA